MAHDAASGSEFRPYISPEQDIPEFTPKAIILGVVLRHHLRRRDGLPRAARRPDGLGVDPDRGALDRRLQEARQVDDPREQHRADDRLGRRVGRGRRRLHACRRCSSSPAARSTSATCRSSCSRRRRHPRRALHDPAAPRADRQGAREAAVPGGHGLRRRPHRRREGRQPGEAGLRGRLARPLLYKFLYGILGLWHETATWFRTGKNGTISRRDAQRDITPEYLGVGYIIGPRIAGELVSGGVLSWLVLIPLISIFVPEHARSIADLQGARLHRRLDGEHTRTRKWIYRAYVRYIGAGAVACAGVMTLIRTLPTIVSAFRESLKTLRRRRGPRPAEAHRARPPHGHRRRRLDSSLAHPDRDPPELPARALPGLAPDGPARSSSSASSSSRSRRASSASSARRRTRSRA